MPIQPILPPKAKKQVFVSRLVKDQTEYDLKVHIQQKIQDPDILVEKLHFKYPREVSSFKIACSEQSFDMICQESIWAKNTFVAE